MECIQLIFNWVKSYNCCRMTFMAQLTKVFLLVTNKIINKINKQCLLMYSLIGY